MKIGLTIALGILVIWSILALLQLWWAVLPAVIFVKLTITAGIAVAVTLLVTLAIREYLSEKSMKSKGFIDD